MDAELAGLSRSIDEARSRGDEPRAKALEARVLRVRTGPRLTPESLPFVDVLGDLRAKIADAPTARLPES